MEKEYRTITKEQLDATLKRHKKWLESKEEAGTKADLSGTFLSGADLSEAFLNGANLTWTDLSRTKVDELTLNRARRLEGARAGVNGIWVEETDTAALMPLSPPGSCSCTRPKRTSASLPGRWQSSLASQPRTGRWCRRPARRRRRLPCWPLPANSGPCVSARAVRMPYSSSALTK